MLVETIGLGAYVVVFGIWIVGLLRLLGPHRVEQFAGHASALSRRALEQCWPARLLPTPDQTLHAEIVEAYPGAAARPVQLMAPEPEPVRPASRQVSAPAAQAKPRMPSKWALPSTTLLRAPEAHRVDHNYLSAVARDLGLRLNSYKISAAVDPAPAQGALVSKFEVTPTLSQEIKPIMARQVDLEAAYKGLRFVSMPGTGKLGIEIPLPDKQRRAIAMREVLDSPAWTETAAALPIALGVTASGEPVVVDLATCPHLLAAGATGAGKSVGLNVMLTSLLLCNSPAELQLLLIDAKLVEFARYRGLPHLLTPPVTEVQEAIAKLQWAVEEMERRYIRFVEADVTELDDFNSVSEQRLPRIVVVIDEYSDLTSAPRNQVQVEAAVERLAQKARGAGIHLIVATQRPSVDVIGGVIKANFPSRIAYKVAQREDSKTIIGQQGAQLLLGNGDSLCLFPKRGIDIERIHGAYVDAPEVRAVCNAWKAQTDPAQPEPVLAKPAQTVKAEEPPNDASAATESLALTSRPSELAIIDSKKSQPDELYEKAVAYARDKQVVSARRLMDELRCGFGIANKLFERMKEDNFIKTGGPNNTHIYCGPS